MKSLFDKYEISSYELSSRSYHAPHVTNLNRRDRFSQRYISYLKERAINQVGIIVTEYASVTSDDWPYEYAPLAPLLGPSLRGLVDQIHETNAKVIFGLSHSGGQGSSAYSQQVLLGPSPFPETNSRELCTGASKDQIKEIINGFCNACKIGLEAGCDGIEINGGQFSLIRQFLSSLTNVRDDEYGSDRLRLLNELTEATRKIMGNRLIGLRLSIDELAPWGGISPENAHEITDQFRDRFDYIAIERGGIYSQSETDPDFHAGILFMADAIKRMPPKVESRPRIVFGGGIYTIEDANFALNELGADLVDLTKVLIADSMFVTKSAKDLAPTPCIACNRGCCVRDSRNPPIYCTVNPRVGNEDTQPKTQIKSVTHRNLMDKPKPRLSIVGGGIAGMHAALEAVGHFDQVTIYEASSHLGGLLAKYSPFHPNYHMQALLSYYIKQINESPIKLLLEYEVDPDELMERQSSLNPIIIASGSQFNTTIPIHCDLGQFDLGPRVISPIELFSTAEELAGKSIVIYDPIGAETAVALADFLILQNISFHFVTTDSIIGTGLSLTNDLVGANHRLLRSGNEVTYEAVSPIVQHDGLHLISSFSSELIKIPCDIIVDASPYRANDIRWRDLNFELIGDAQAPRTLAHATYDAKVAIEGVIEKLYASTNQGGH
ncbi:NAD(P)-binding protein [Acidithrix sp. C25]|uniref:oxidoreductase n=1 Tax=Acidithrix sp. C25 TaxID=1671482 RepID=UPI00191BA9FB|nr:NAD(P)-binding protein [Acidithrix sp. C25]CAG4902876.1 unnamed protein product [Acidithrix sp. C25]